MFLGNWCEFNIGGHDKDSDSLSLTETVESADNMDAYAIEGDNSSDNELEESGKSGNVTGTALQQKALNYLIKIKEENRIPKWTVENIAFATFFFFLLSFSDFSHNSFSTSFGPFAQFLAVISHLYTN